MQMRLPDEFLNYIAYLGWPAPDGADKFDTVGTGFFVQHEGAFYIVTAAHVALDFVDVPFGIRLNKASDGLGEVEHVSHATWYFHLDPAIDVAVLPYHPPEWGRANAFPTKHVISDFKRDTKNIGPGDLTYLVGVYQPTL